MKSVRRISEKELKRLNDELEKQKKEISKVEAPNSLKLVFEKYKKGALYDFI